MFVARGDPVRDDGNTVPRHPAKRQVELTERELRWTREYASEGVRLVRSSRTPVAPSAHSPARSER
jgi:hypothetical protein